MENIADKVGWGKVKPPPQISKYGILYLIFALFQTAFWVYLAFPKQETLTEQYLASFAKMLAWGTIKGKLFVLMFVLSLIFPIIMTVKTVDLSKENKMSASLGLLIVSKIVMLPFIIYLGEYIVTVVVLSSVFFTGMGFLLEEFSIFLLIFGPIIVFYAMVLWGWSGVVAFYIMALTIILSIPMLFHLQVLRKNKVISFVQQVFFSLFLLLPGFDYFICLFLIIGKSRKYLINYKKMPNNSNIVD